MVKVVAVLLLFFGCAANASAQIVRGTVVDDSNNAPLNGVFIVLLDSMGVQRGATLSNEKGFFAVRAPVVGSYRLRAERIGHSSITTASFTLSESAHTQDLRIPVAAIVLEPIGVTGTRRCELRRDQGRRAAQLWEEARKALSVALWVEKEKRIQFEWRTYERELDAYTLRVRQESVKYGISTTRPYRAISADSLAKFGFVQDDGNDVVYFGLDADVLLSDQFLEQHCFRTVAGGQDRPGLIGLAFEPLRTRKLRDISGTLWMDAKTFELRYIEFRYTGLPRNYDVQNLGGRTNFQRLANGVWIVDRWYIRMPMAAISSGNSTLRLTALKEDGGEVTEIIDETGAIRVSLEGVVRGTVYDSVRAAPLVNATVYLSGTSHRAYSDSAGQFKIAGVPDGNYTLAFTHGTVDSLPALPKPRHITIAPKDTVEAALALPSVATHMVEKCGAYNTSPAGRKTVAMLFGYVFDEAGQSVPDAAVKVLYRFYERAKGNGVPFTEKRDISKVTTDKTGRYEICKLPLLELLAVSVEYRDEESKPIEVRIGILPFKRLDLVFDK